MGILSRCQAPSNTGELELQYYMTGPEQTEKKDKYTDHFNTGYVG